jgi:hypothetical protein
LVQPDVFKDRVVLIGTTAAGTFEHRSTPFSPVQPAVELQANAVDDILSSRPLRSPNVWLQAALLLGFSALSGVLTAPRRALGGTLWILGLSAVLWQCAALAMGLGNVYIPIAAALCGGLLTYALTTALNYRWEWEANWRADEAAAALARGSDLMASVRDRPRLLTVINATAREALGAEHIFLVLDEQTNNELCWMSRGEWPRANRVLVWPTGDHSQKMTHDVKLRRLRIETSLRRQVAPRNHGYPLEIPMNHCASCVRRLAAGKVSLALLSRRLWPIRNHSMLSREKGFPRAGRRPDRCGPARWTNLHRARRGFCGDTGPSGGTGFGTPAIL